MGNWLYREDKAESERRRQKEFTDIVSDKRISVILKRPGELNRRDLNFPNHLYISLFGESGIGKTSLINSMKYALFGGLSSNHEQSVPTNYFRSHTMRRVLVRLTNSLSVIDYRAIKEEDLSRVGVQNEVISHLDGKYQVGRIEWDGSGDVRRIESDDKSYCTILVFSAKDENTARSYESFIQRLHEWQGTFPLAVITRVDEAGAGPVRQVLEGMGIARIFEVANRTNTNPHLSQQSQRSVLELLEKCFEIGDEVFSYRSDFERGH